MKESSELFRSGLSLYQSGDPAAALDVAQSGLGRFPDDGMLWQLSGMARRLLKDWAAARQALETAATLVPLDSAARCALADCYAQEGRTELAGWMYRELAFSRGCPTSLLPALAAGLGSIGEYAQALEVCGELARREPERPEPLFSMAYYMRRLGQPADRLVPLLTRAHELDPASVPYRVVLASLLAETGRGDEALDLVRAIPAGSVDCRCCLGRIRALFDRYGENR